MSEKPNNEIKQQEEQEEQEEKEELKTEDLEDVSGGFAEEPDDWGIYGVQKQK